MSNFLNFNGNQGMSFKTFTASGTSYTLDKSASTNSVLVSVGGVMQQPGVDYTVSGTTLTSTSAWTAGVQVDTWIVHKPGTAPVIQDNSVTSAKIANDQIDSQHYAAGSIDLEHMSSQSVDEDNLHISNAGSNGNVLSKQSGDAGGLTWAAAGGGKILQVVQSKRDAAQSHTTSSTWSSTSHTGTITLSATSSKLLAILTAHLYGYTNNNTGIDLYYDIGGAGYNSMGVPTRGNGLNEGVSCALSVLVSPSSTAALTVAVYYKSYNGTNNVYYNYNGTSSTYSNLLLMEIGA